MTGRLEPPIRIALCAWGVLALAVAAKTCVSPTDHTVFPKFAAGADHWWARQPLYFDAEHLGAFRYSPIFAVMMTPFSAMGPRAGGIAWAWLGIAAYVGGIIALARRVLPGSWPAERTAALLLLAIPGALRGIWNAQSNTLVSGLMMLACAAVVQRRAWAAAVALAAAVLMKLSPIAIALLLAALWPAMLAGPLAVALAVGLLLPFATAPTAYVLQAYRGWAAYLATSSTQRWPSFRDAWTIWEYFAPVSVVGYRILQATAGLAVLLLCLRVRWRNPDPQHVATAVLGLGTAYLMVFGPAVEFATYAWIAPIAAWVLLEGLERRRGAGLAAAGYLLTSLAGYVVTKPWVVAHIKAAGMALPLGSLLVLICVVLYLDREPLAPNL